MTDAPPPPADASLAVSVSEPGEHPLVIRMPVDVRSLTLSVLAAIAGVWFLGYAAPVLIPIVIGIFISYALNPLVNGLERVRVPRAVGSGVAVLLLMAVLGGGTYALSGQAMAILERVPEVAARLRDRLESRARVAEASPLEVVQRAADEIDRTAEEATASTAVSARAGVQRVQIVEPAFRAIDYMRIGGRGVVALVVQLAFVLFLVYFILLSGDLYKRKLVRLAGPTLTQKRITVQVLDDINRQIGQFIQLQVIVNLAVGVVTAAALWLMGLENYLFWGLLAAICNSIPYFGPLIVTVGLGVVAFLQFDDVIRTITVCAVAGAITGIEGMLLRPALLSRASQINPVAIFLGLLFWSWIWGLWGTVLAVPMVMIAKATADRVEALQPLGELLSGGRVRESFRTS